MKRRILFVDDEENVLHGLRRLLHGMKDEWEMEFHPDPEKALAAVRSGGVEVVVSDFRMPGMDGLRLLEQVKKIDGHIVRLLLSGQVDQKMAVQSMGVAHQFLTKPCDPQTLKEGIERAFATREGLMGDSLKSTLAGMPHIPSAPALFQEIAGEIQRSEGSTRKVGTLISQDIGLTGAVLKLINSSYFGMRRKIGSPEEAVNLLGLNTLKTLVLSIEMNRQIACPPRFEGFVGQVNEHSMRCGLCARAIAQKEGVDAAFAGSAFTAAVLHDAGKLLLLANFPDRSGEYLETIRLGPAHEVERRLFGASHAEIGAYLLGLWGLPDEIVDAIAFHHEPSRSMNQAFSPLSVVHFSELAASDEEGAVAEFRALDREYYARLKMESHLIDWTAIAKTLKATLAA
jgi:putative nucleotidyltransferase with HDIG domain